ncbi:hypothetical protein [Nesterenkonia haasae]|uniref:hypothetical protein n=1 Tax=Nesterenkonia haasae TaxID=2587813 RepID=UPI0013912737|nr:hypothetical protein [Nesterenkonia haasae]NDK31237.1 hypothetical protein [Nesterenkonia haasae]
MRPARFWTALPLIALTLTGCEDTPEADGSPLGGGSLDSSVAEAQVTAPEPRGQQLSHPEMVEALESTLSSATITDTDDWWPNLRDLNRELQRLEVQPVDCKPYVTASALPMPAGALGALAESADSQTVIYTFEDSTAAEDYMDSERAGVERCAEHKVVRDLGEDEAQAETTLTELRVRTGAQDALAVGRVMEASDITQRDLTVLLRQGPHAVLAAEQEDPDAEQEDAIAELEARAAEVLSTLIGEEIVAPEPEPEPEDESEDEPEEDSESEEEGEPEGEND